MYCSSLEHSLEKVAEKVSFSRDFTLRSEIMTKTKVISLDDDLWTLASKKNNFSQWVSEQLKKEVEGKKIISQAFSLVSDELVKQKSESEQRLSNAQNAWDDCKEKDKQLARLVYERTRLRVGGKVVISKYAPALESCIDEFYHMLGASTPSPDPTPKEMI
jgi:hypothetical protein